MDEKPEHQHTIMKPSKVHQLQMQAAKCLIGNRIFKLEHSLVGRKLAELDRLFVREAVEKAVSEKNAKAIMTALEDYKLQDLDLESLSADLLIAVLEDDSLEEVERLKIFKTLMMEKNAKPNYTGETGISPLHVAALQGNTEAIHLLIRAGAIINPRDEHGITPLFGGVWSENPEVLKLLLAAGADTKLADNSGSTPLHVAAIRGNAEAVKALIAAGANVNLVACVLTFDDSPLHLAACSGDVESIQALIDAGANLNLKDSNNNTPLQVAMSKGHEHAVALLKRAED